MNIMIKSIKNATLFASVFALLRKWYVLQDVCKRSAVSLQQYHCICGVLDKLKASSLFVHNDRHTKCKCLCGIESIAFYGDIDQSSWTCDQSGNISWVADSSGKHDGRSGNFFAIFNIWSISEDKKVCFCCVAGVNNIIQMPDEKRNPPDKHKIIVGRFQRRRSVDRRQARICHLHCFTWSSIYIVCTSTGVLAITKYCVKMFRLLISFA